MAGEEGPRRAVNMSAAGPWISAGLKRFEVVENSWFIYHHNSIELVEILRFPSTNFRQFLKIATMGPQDSWSFWASFNQRLHNFLASVGSAIDHVRRLWQYYEDDAPEFVTELRSRNQEVADLPQAKFVRELRNYMLHCSQPPLVTVIPLGSEKPPKIKFDAQALLRQKDREWGSATRQYLESYPAGGGPDIITDIGKYIERMDDVFDWIFQQRGTLTATYPDRFWVDL